MSDLADRICELERQAALDDLSDVIALSDRTMPSTMQNAGDAFLTSLGQAYDISKGNVEDSPRQFRSTPNRERMNLDVALAQYAQRMRGGLLGPRHADVLCSFAAASYVRGASIAESPIEKDLLPWIITADWSPARMTPVPVVLPGHDMPPFETDIVIMPQMVVGPFRLDFAICLRLKGRLLIIALECDGAEFHDAAKDHRRDALLMAAGIRTVRASGREIKDHPQQVVGRARRIAAEWGAAP